MPRLLEPDPDHAGVGKYIKPHLYFSSPFSGAYPCPEKIPLFKTSIRMKFSTTKAWSCGPGFLTEL